MLAPILRIEDKLRGDFEQEYSRFFQRRDEWIVRHPDFDYTTPKPLTDLLPSTGRVLVISPHPDDEIIGCGGTILLLKGRGYDVTILQLTDGAASAALSGATGKYRLTSRLREARLVADYLKIEDLRLWRLSDSNFLVDQVIVQRMMELIRELKPSVIFVPFYDDLHPDHVKSNQLLGRALAGLEMESEIAICLYETWALVAANCFLVTSEYFENKISALALYRIPLRVVDYVRYCARRDALHHYNSMGVYGFSEQFQYHTVPTYLKLMEEKPLGE